MTSNISNKNLLFLGAILLVSLVGIGEFTIYQAANYGIDSAVATESVKPSGSTCSAVCIGGSESGQSCDPSNNTCADKADCKLFSEIEQNKAQGVCNDVSGAFCNEDRECSKGDCIIQSETSCGGGVEVCHDQIDNDKDGNIDCNDSDCNCKDDKVLADIFHYFCSESGSEKNCKTNCALSGVDSTLCSNQCTLCDEYGIGGKVTLRDSFTQKQRDGKSEQLITLSKDSTSGFVQSSLPIEIVTVEDNPRKIVLESNTGFTEKAGAIIDVAEFGVKNISDKGKAEFPGKFLGGIEFGITGKDIIFTEPVEISFPVEGKTFGDTVAVYLRHADSTTFDTRGLTLDRNDTCTNGIPSKPGNSVKVDNTGYVTIYTCMASEGGASGEACTDGLDNDGDGYFDCSDSECSANAACTNGSIDTDNDGVPVGGADNDVSTEADNDCNDNDINTGELSTWLNDEDGDGFPGATSVDSCTSPGPSWVKVGCTTGNVAGHYSTTDNGDGTCTLTIQPNATFGKDTYVHRRNSSTTYNTSTLIYAHYNASSTTYNTRTMLQYDFDSILGSAGISSIQNADIELYKITSYNDSRRYRDQSLDVHRVTESRDPNSVTWNTQPNHAELIDTQTRAWDNVGRLDFSVTGYVNDVLGGTFTNHGWKLIGDEGQYADFRAYSSNYTTDPTLRAKMVITYSSGSANDCDDTPTGAGINPGATEIVGDGIDQNCDGAELCYVDGDNDGWRLDTTVVSPNLSCEDSGEGLASDPSVDCDDAVNTTFGPVDYYYDEDGDGFANGTSQNSCGAPDGSGNWYTADQLIDNTHTESTLDNGLVAYWNFDGESVIDISPSTLGGQIYGTVPYVDGYLSDGIEFTNVVTNYVKSDNSLPLSGDVETTIALWVKTDWTVTTWNTPVWMTPNQTNRGLGVTLNGGRLAMDFWVNRLRATTPIQLDTWTHVAVTKTPGLISTSSKLYVNGVEVSGNIEGTDTVPDVISNDVWLGNLASASHTRGSQFNGSMDDVRIYNRALSSGEIEDLYVSTNGYDSGDCLDTDSTINPRTTWYLDADGDGWREGTTQKGCTEPTPNSDWKLEVELIDGGVVDCDDTLGTFSGPVEWYFDEDADGYSNGTSQNGCAAPDVSGNRYTLEGLIENNHAQSSLDDGLIAYWTFDAEDGSDTSGSATEHSGTPSAGLTFVDGIKGKAVSFPGNTNESINITDIPAGMGTFTLSTRMYNDSSSGGNSRHSMLRNFWEVVGTQLCFWSYDFDNDYWRCSASGEVPYDVWTNITTVWDGTVITHYANGEEIWKDTATSGGSNQAFSSIGGYGGRMMKGILDEMRVYDRDLSPEEVQSLYKAFTVYIDGDAVSNSCDDTDSTRNPGAIEIVGDGIDQNCDGAELCYVDADNDGWRLDTTVVSPNLSCEDSGEGLASDPSVDCDDAVNTTFGPVDYYYDEDGDGFANGVLQSSCGLPDASGDWYTTEQLIDNTHIQSTIDDGLIAYWSFDAGDATDSSENSHDGVASDSTVTYGEGKLGNAIILDGTNQVSVPNHTDFNTNVISFGGWHKGDNTTFNGYDAFITHRTGNNGFILRGNTGTDTIQAYVRLGGWVNASFNMTESVTEWHHYFATYDGIEIKLYVDGVLKKTTAAAGTRVQANGPIYIGLDGSNTTSHMEGMLDDMRVYNRALSDSEVADLYVSTNNYLDGDTGLCNPNDVDNNLRTLWYLDADNDGYSNGTTQKGCEDPDLANIPQTTEWKLASELLDNGAGVDCDESSANATSIHPGAIEIPGDNIDQNCNGSEVCYIDADNDGWRLAATFDSLDADCDDDGEALASDPSIDCDDTDGGIYEGDSYYYDGDNDGFSDGTTVGICGGDLNSGLIAQWNFDDNSIEDSIGTNDGVEQSGVGYGEGKSGNALSLDGINDYARIPYDSSLEPQTFSVGSWIYVDSSITPETYGVILDNSQNSHSAPYYNVHMRLDSLNLTNPTLRSCVVIGGWDANDCVLATGVVTKDAWNHVMMTYDGTTITTYVNGGNASSSSNPGTLVYEQNDWYIGAFKNISSGNFPGKIDDVRIYDRALTSGEVDNLVTTTNHKTLGELRVDAQNSSVQEGLIARYSFDAGDATDDSGNGNDGTLAGSLNQTTGITGDGYEFDGDDYITIDGSDTWDTTQDFTMCQWIKKDSGPSAHEFIAIKRNGSDNTTPLNLYVHSTGRIYFLMGGGSNFNIAQSSVLTYSGDWKLLCAGIENNEMKLYVNGTQAGSTIQFQGTRQSNSDFLAIGGDYDDYVSNRFNGVIDDVRYYDRMLSASEITELYNASNAAYPSETVVCDTNFDIYPGAYEFCDGIDNNCSGVVDENTTSDYYLDADGDGYSDGTTAEYCSNATTVGLKAHYTFDNNDLVDSIGGFDGSGTVGYGAGSNDRGVALELDGTTHAQLPNDILGNTEDDFSFGLWVKRIDSGGYVLWQNESQLSFSGDGFRFRHFDVDGTQTWLNAYNTCTTGDRCHVYVTRKGTELSLYVNGTVGATATVSSALRGGLVFLGRDEGTSRLNGSLDDLRVYSRALSSNEIEALYNTTNTYQTAEQLKVTAQEISVQEGLIARYSFDNNDFTDDSGNGITATPQGTITFDDGYVGSAAYFNGGNSNVINLVDPGYGANDDLTISYWFKQEAAKATQSYPIQRGVGTGRLRGGVVSANQTELRTNIYFGGGCDMYVALGDISDGAWYNVTMSMDVDGNKDVYLDGVLVDSEDMSACFSGWDLSSQFQIGEGIHGYMDEVRIYNRALPSTEVLELYSSVSGVYPSETTVCDANFEVHPGVQDICDGVDNNCDGQIDEGLMADYYLDNDGDGYAENGNTINTCNPQAFIPANTLVHYTFDDENADNAISASHNGTPDSSVSYSDGINGKSAELDGTGKINLDPMTSIKNQIFTERTYSFWMKSDTSGVYQTIYDEGDYNDYVIWFVLNPSNQMEIYFGGSDFIGTEVNSFEADTWYHVVVVYDNLDGISVHINGEKNANVDTTPQPISARNGTANIGDIDDTLIGSGLHFDGKIDEFMIIDRALPESEIQQLYSVSAYQLAEDLRMKAQSNSVQDGLVGRWSFDNEDGTDDTGNGYDANTVIGTPEYIDGPIGKVLDVANSNDSLQTNIGNSITDRSFSIASHIYADSITADKIFLSTGNGSIVNRDLHMRVRADGRIRVGFFGNDFYVPAGTFTEGEWNYLVFTYDAETRQGTMYKNDQIVHQRNFAANYQGEGLLTIGSWRGTTQFWPGLIDEVRIYDRVLSQIDVNDLYAMVSGEYPSETTICDANFEVHPGIQDICDTIDNNCSGIADDNTRYYNDFYPDPDGDGFVEASSVISQCFNPDAATHIELNAACSGYRTLAGFNNATYEFISFDRNGITYEYTGDDNEGFAQFMQDTIRSFGYETTISYIDGDYPCPAGQLCVSNPDAATLVFDGYIADWTSLGYRDPGSISCTPDFICTEDEGSVSLDYSACGTPGWLGECAEGNATAYPNAPEICDGIDNNCNLVIDEEVTTGILYKDEDGDGYSDGTTVSGACLDTELNLVAHYEFDDDTATDTSGNGNNGAINGANAIDGKVGRSLEFENSDSVIVSDDDSLDITDELTVSLWVNASDVSNIGTLITKLASSGSTDYQNTPYGILIAANSVYFFTSRNDVYDFAYAPIFANERAHITATVSGTEIRIYKDGTLVGTGVRNISPLATNGDLVLGTIGNTYPLEGSLDDVRVYNRALTASEIQGIYYSTSGYKTIDNLKTTAQNNAHQDGLVARWSFEGDLGTEDETGNGNNGNLLWGAIVENGIIGKGLTLDGTNDYLEINDTVGDLGVSDFTLGAIVKLAPEFTQSNNTIISTYNNQSEGFDVFVQNDGRIIFLVRENATTGKSVAVASNIGLEVDKTYDLKFTREGTEHCIYINGVQNSCSTSSDVFDVSNNITLRIGQRGSIDNHPFAGNLDEVRIYNRAWKESEVAEHYSIYGASYPYETITCDINGNIHPGQKDLCGDTIDNNCNGTTDYKHGSPSEIVCEFCDHYQLTIPYEECKALEELYTLSDGANWSNNTNWLTSPDVNTWYGVSVEGGEIDDGVAIVGYVNDLKLPNNQLDGPLGAQIGILQLKTLDLSTNQLSGPVPSEIFSVNIEESLNLSNNQLSGSLPVEIGNLDLEGSGGLNLSNNQFSGPLPVEIGDINLQSSLDLSNNQFSGSLPDEISDAGVQDSLDLSNNQFSGSLPDTFSTDIRVLNLSNNQFTGEIPSTFAGLESVNILDLSNNSLVGSIPESFMAEIIDPDDGEQEIDLDELYLQNNAFDRNSDHNLYETSYITTYLSGLTASNVSNQSDINSPVIDSDDKIPPVISTPIQYEISIDENSYSTAGSLSEIIPQPASGEGMPIEFSGTSVNGTDCTNLSADPITFNGGTGTVVISTSSPSVYEGCTMQVRDHGNNLSNTLTLSTVCSDPALTIPQSECVALVQFYVEFNGFDWVNDTNWLVDPDVNTWFGITSDTNVREISLDNNTLIGEVTSAISSLTYLEVLDISNTTATSLNRITEVLPNSLWTLQNLVTLSLNNVDLSGVGIGLANSKIENISLRENNLGYSDFLEILSIPTIENISVRNNEISGILPQSISNISNLASFNASNNELSGEFLSDWSQFVQLEYFYVGSNELTGSLPDGLLNFLDLTGLGIDVGGNNLDRDASHNAFIAPNQVTGFSTIDELIIDNQGDITPPEITVGSVINDQFVLGNTINVTFSIDENSYAIAGNLSQVADDGEGMFTNIYGGVGCADLDISRVEQNSGQVTIQVSYSGATPATFAGCEFEIEDHAENSTTDIADHTLDTFVFGAEPSDICLHPDMTIPQTECEALVALYTDTGGASWYQNAGWFDGIDPSSWYGVTVENIAGQDHVTKIIMGFNNLQGALPSELSDLTQATELKFPNNMLTNLETGFSTNTALEILWLQGNSFVTLPTDFGGLSGLKQLDLSGNLIEALPSSIGDLDQLDVLNVRNNKIITLPSDIGSLPELDTLDVSSNAIVTLPVEITQLSDLDSLFASNNKLQVLPTGFNSLPALATLDLSFNQFIDLNGSLTGMPVITTLNLSNNALTTVDSSLVGLTTLQSLFLNNNQISTIDTGINNLAALLHLNLENNNLATVPDELGELGAIVQLNLSENQLVALPLTLENSTTLELLFISDNDLPELPEFLGSIVTLKQLWLDDNNLHSYDDGSTRVTIPDSYSGLTNITRFILSNNFLDRVVGNTVLTQPLIDSWIANSPQPLGFNLAGQQDDTPPILSGSGVIIDPSPSIAYELTVEENSYAIDGSGEGMDIIFAGGNNCTLLNAIVGATGGNTIDEKAGIFPITIASSTDAYFTNCTVQVRDHAGNLSNPVVLGSFQLSNSIETFCAHPNLSITENECDALYELYVGTNGDEDGRTNDANWFVSLDVETWFGVETADLGNGKNNVTGLYLHKSSGVDELGPTSGWNGNGIIGPLPSNLGNLVHMETLSMSNNLISGEIPTTIGSLTSLEELWLINGNLTGEIPASVGLLDALVALQLGGNELSGSLPTQFYDMDALKAVDLSNNLLSGILEDTWDAFTNMISVRLGGNSFEGSLPATLGTQSTLQYLRLENNEFTGRIPNEYDTGLGVLSSFNVSGNNLDRLNTLRAITTSSQDTWLVTSGGNVGNQGDITKPLISGSGTIPFSVSVSASYDLTVNENSFAVDTSGDGMELSALGGACSSLEFSEVTWNDGSTQTITITPTAPGVYADCEVVLTDHGNNISDPIILPTFSFNIGDAEVCFDPAMSVPVTECLALLTLYQDTDGENSWSNNTHWFDDATANGFEVNTWFGVNTSAVGSGGQHHVTEIFLHRDDVTTDTRNILTGNGLTGTLPDVFGSFSYLEKVYVDGNGLLGSLPVSLGTVNTVTHVGFSDNQLTGEIPSQWDGMTSVEELYLRDNQLSGTYPILLDNAVDLKVVDLSNNQFTGPLAISDGTLLQLEEFIIDTNQFTGALPSSVTAMTQLRTLRVNDNDLTQSLPALGSLTNLITLALENNTFSGEIPDGWSGLDSLVTLTMQNNDLEGDILGLLGSLDSLTTANIANNEFVGLLGGQFGSSSVTSLNIEGNNFDRSPDHKAVIVSGFESRFQLPAMTTYNSDNQGDITPPRLESTQPIYSPVAGAIEYIFTIDENSYPVTNGGSGMALDVTGQGGCSTIFHDVSEVVKQDGEIIVSLFAADNQVYQCQITVTDHGGNVGSYDLPVFRFNSLCGNGTTDAGEVCDEGSFCDDGTECTGNASVCPTECRPRLTDNCNPSCTASTCGDRYVDADGIDNISGNFDDETCDQGSYCDNGNDCTNDPTICSNGAFECQPRALNGCSARCTAGACGDGSYDPDGADNIEGNIDDEQCDDGNLNDGDGCSSSCTVEFCGDGYVDTNGPNNDGVGAEQCDQGQNNGVVGGVCSSTCTLPNDECVFCYETCDGGAGQHEIFLMIDTSGSMNTNNRLQNAQNGALNFISLVESAQEGNPNFTTEIGVIEFNNGATILVDPENLGGVNPYLNARNAINNLTAGGGTNFGDAIQAGLNYFDSNLSNQSYTHHLVLLSDGEPTVGGPSPYQDAGVWAITQANAAKTNDVNLYTIAVDQTDEGIEYMSYMSSSTKLNQAWQGPDNGNQFTKPVSMSSSAGSAYPASHGNNGTKAGYEYALSDEEYQARWEIDINDTIEIETINVWNRTSNTQETSDFYVHVSDSPFGNQTLDQILADGNVTSVLTTGEAGRPTELDFGGLEGQYVRVQLSTPDPSSGGSSGETFQYTDPGGSGRYSNYEYEVTTFCPTDTTEKLTVEFSSFDVERNYDFLYVYNGTSTNATRLARLHGYGIPSPITSTHSQGCLTFLFDSDYSVTRPGWVATLTAGSTNSNDVNLGLSEVEVIGCKGSAAECTDIYHYQDFGGIALDTLYGHVFGNIHCDCPPERVCGVCGDGATEASVGEECDTGSYCDDWNGTSGTACVLNSGGTTECDANPALGECRPRLKDGCTDQCKDFNCGDGITQYLDQAYVNANSITGDACFTINDCPFNQYCAGVFDGSGVTDRICVSQAVMEAGGTNGVGDEQCDDGGDAAGDGCSPTCQFESCGDGFYDFDGPDNIFGTADDESCDDGNTDSGDGCSSTCVEENDCGDGVVDADGPDNIPGNEDDELCDEGSFCDELATIPCSGDAYCVSIGYPLNSCNPRFVNECTPSCTGGTCGDGIIDVNGADNILNSTLPSDDEQCDAGRFCAEGSTGPSGENLTGINCSLDESICGTGACETADQDYCSQLCLLPFCGDNYVTDNAITINFYDCIAGSNECGDGLVDPDGQDNELGTADDEQCDDGGTIGGDGCSATCKFEVNAGDGGTNYCTNGVEDTAQGETGIDCGGDCQACPTCTDYLQNGDETGVDCGGSCPNAC